MGRSEIIAGAGMAHLLAKLAEREELEAPHIEIRRQIERGLPPGLDGMNRKERRSYGSKKLRLKGLRP